MNLKNAKGWDRNSNGVKYWRFDCSENCGNEIKVFNHTKDSCSGKCRDCSAKNRRIKSYTVDESKILRIEIVQLKRQKQKIWVLKCLDCEAEIRVWPGQRGSASGKCASCVNKGKPYQHVLTSIRNAARIKNLECPLSLDDITEFAQTKKCTYCAISISWTQFWSKFSPSHAYYLDRKNNSKGYTKENCVVCCTDCNFIRGDKFTYEEFLLLSPGLRKIRKLKQVTNYL